MNDDLLEKIRQNELEALAASGFNSSLTALLAAADVDFNKTKDNIWLERT